MTLVPGTKPTYNLGKGVVEFVGWTAINPSVVE
jgi:hypothetical protein